MSVYNSYCKTLLVPTKTGEVQKKVTPILLFGVGNRAVAMQGCMLSEDE